MKLSDIKPYPKNAKKHTKKHIQQIANSIQEFGFNQSIVVDKEGIIIVGHGRYEAALFLELEKVPITVIDLSDEQARAYRLADNKLNESDWDMKLVVEELRGLSGPMIELTGFEPKLILFPEERDDKIPKEVPAIAKLGDIWLLGDHRVMCGDATEKEDVEKLMDGKKADIVFTSPPYSDMREYNGEKDLSVDNLANFIKVFVNYTDYYVINLGIQRKDGYINPYWNFYTDAAESVGYKMLSWNVWNRETAKSVGQMTAMFPIEHEWIFVYGKNVKKLNPTVPNKEAGKLNDHNSRRNKDGTIKKAKNMIIRSHRELGTVLTLPPQLARNVDSTHSAMFPVEFPIKYIEAMAEESVIDPFIGSGSTLIAAEKTDRICYGMDIEPKYVDLTIKRWEEYTGHKAKKI